MPPPSDELTGSEASGGQIENTAATAQHISFDQLAQILAKQNEFNQTQLRQQLEHSQTQFAKQLDVLAKAVTKTPTVHSTGSDLKYPSFSGDDKSDVKSFIDELNSKAAYNNADTTRKANLLPNLLTGNAKIWFQSSTHLSGKSYEEMCEALIQQFHTKTDEWVLMQQIANKKQMPKETVAEFASEIRRLSHKLDLPEKQRLTHFLQGLRPELRNIVALREPTNLNDAEAYAKLKESLPDEKPVDRTDEILKAIALSKTLDEPRVAAINTPFTSHNSPRTNTPHERPLSREDILQIIRQEFRRSRNQQAQGQDYRNRRTFDGRPICNYCRKSGHVAYVCRKRQFDNRDPRLPPQNDRQMTQNSRPVYSAPNDRQNLN